MTLPAKQTDSAFDTLEDFRPGPNPGTSISSL